MEAEHKLKMKLLEDEQKQKYLFMKEEHEIKMKIYKAQEQILLHKLNTSTHYKR